MINCHRVHNTSIIITAFNYVSGEDKLNYVENAVDYHYGLICRAQLLVCCKINQIFYHLSINYCRGMERGACKGAGHLVQVSGAPD